MTIIWDTTWGEELERAITAELDRLEDILQRANDGETDEEPIDWRGYSYCSCADCHLRVVAGMTVEATYRAVQQGLVSEDPTPPRAVGEGT